MINAAHLPLPAQANTLCSRHEALAAQIRSGHPATSAQLAMLAGDPLPELAALAAELFPAQSPPLARPALQLSLAGSLSSLGSYEALRRGSEFLSGYEEANARTTERFLIVDSWTGTGGGSSAARSSFSLASLLEVLGQLYAVEHSHFRFTVVGPSTGELKQMQRQSGDPIESLLRRLHATGIDTIEGGSDLELHLAAARQGFALHYTLMLGHTAEETPTESLLQQLTAVQEVLHSTDALRTVSLLLAAPLDRTGSGARTARLGAPQLLRYACMVRCALPHVPQLRLSVPLLGLATAELALSFGANDLGYAAVNDETAHALGLPHIRELRPLGVEC